MERLHDYRWEDREDCVRITLQAPEACVFSQSHLQHGRFDVRCVLARGELRPCIFELRNLLGPIKGAEVSLADGGRRAKLTLLKTEQLPWRYLLGREDEGSDNDSEIWDEFFGSDETESGVPALTD